DEAVGADVVGDLEAFAGGHFGEVAIQLVTGGETDRVNDAVDALGPLLLQLGEYLLDLGIVGHVTGKAHVCAGTPAGGEFFHTALELVVLVGEGQLGTFAVHGCGDARGNGQLAGYTNDEYTLSAKKSHVLFLFLWASQRGRSFGHRVGDGCLEQLTGIVMLWSGEDLLRRPLFYNFTLANDHQLVTEGPDHRQVVADKQIAQIVPALQVPQPLHHLALHSTLPCRGRPVRQDQRRLERECPGDRDPLALPAGKLVRIAMPAVRIQPHFTQGVDHHLLPFGGGADAVQLQPFADDLLHRHARTQTAKGVLEHHLELAPGRAYRLLAQSIQALTVAFYQALALDQTQQRQAQRGLARTTFADDTQGLPRLQGKAGIGHCLDVTHGALEHALADREPDPQLLGAHHHGRIRLHFHRGAGRVGGNQLTGVLVLRIGEQFGTIILFDDLTAVHDTYSVSNFAYQVQIVTDQ